MTYLARDVHGMGAIDFSQIGKDLGSAALVSSAEAATALPVYRLNRARLAAVIDLGYSTLDTYQAAKPGIFMVSLAGFIASSYGLAKRRKAAPEAKALYPLCMLATGLVAWFTRPEWFLAATPMPQEVDPNAPGAVRTAVDALDRRVAQRSATRPGWESTTWSRLWGDLGSGTMAPVVNTLLTKNSH